MQLLAPSPAEMDDRILEKSENTTNTATYAFPLSFAQQRLWFLHQYEPNNPVYHTHLRLHLRGRLDVEALQQSLDTLVARHEILRTTFALRGDEPMQIVAPPTADWAKISLYERPDWAGLPGAEQREQIVEFLRAEGDGPFDMQVGPLFRSLLIRLTPQEHIFQIARHHIITDAWSSQIFWRELSALYNSYLAEQPNPLPPVPLQYADFAVWQRERLQGEILERELAYWRTQLQDSQPLSLQADRPHPLALSYRGASERFTLTPEQIAPLNALGVAESSTLFITLLSVFYVLLYRYTGQDDIAIGTPIANRNRSELEGVMGLFLNTLVLRAQPQGSMTFRQLLRHVRALTLEAYQHQEIPFEKLVEELQPPRITNRHPFFQTMFVLNQERELQQSLKGLTVERVSSSSETAKFDLSLLFSEENGVLNGHLNYATDLFNASTIQRMIGHFQTLLAGIVANPDCPIGELPLLTEVERHHILAEWNNTGADNTVCPSVVQSIQQHAVYTPEKVAMEGVSRTLSYGELNEEANRMAYRFIREGITRNTLVGLFVRPDTRTFISLLAILKVGAAYLPLDADQPVDRLIQMLSITRPAFILLDERPRCFSLSEKVAVNCTFLAPLPLTEYPAQNPEIVVNPDDTAYVLFTSGSTGEPKAIAQTYRTLDNLAEWQRSHRRLAQPSRTLQLSTLTFDVSLQEILTTWSVGGTLVIPPSDLKLEPSRLLRYISDKQIERLYLPYSILQLLADYVDENEGLTFRLQDIVVAGETLHLTPSIRSWMRRLADCRLHNHYGPTETHVVTARTLTTDIDQWPVDAPIGTPIANTQTFVLDALQQPVPIGVPGELYVGGAGLALGYLNRPDLTAERFVPHPFNDEPGARLYRTGDLARYREDGVIEFLGRVDRQVKIRGFRVEPGEIESVLREHPAVRDGIVGVLDDETLGKRLIAWWIGKPEAEASGDDLRSFLRQRLPDYMIPAAFVRVEEFPLNPNGKIDLRQFPDPGREDASALSVSPQTPLERQLLALWQQVLERKNLGTDDNFFDVGGHSLLAVRLMSRVSQVTGQELPVASLFYGPTIRQQAALIEQKGWSPPWTSLVPVQPAGTRPPLFLVPPAASTGLRFAYLTRFFGPEQPIYGFDPGGLDDRSQLHETVEEMAAHFVSEMRQLQPTGPYLLGGMCFGGHVAYEMAQQLGEEAPVVLLLDVGQPANGPSWSLPPRNLLYDWQRFLEYRRAGGHHWKAARVNLQSRWRKLWRRLRHWADPDLQRMGKVYGMQLPAMRNYVAHPTHAKLVLFQSDEPMVHSRQRGWQELSNRLEIIPFPNTTHRSLLLEDENVERIAEKLSEVIDRWMAEYWQDRSL